MDHFERASLPRAGSPIRGSFARALVAAVIGTMVLATVAFGAALKPSVPGPRVAAAAGTAVPIDLALLLEAGAVRIDWSVCDTNGFQYYAIVRSNFDQPTWPLGYDDVLLADVPDIDVTTFQDKISCPARSCSIACSRSPTHWELSRPYASRRFKHRHPAR